ncbi:GH1 family beta-glucosidase [Methylocystis sp. JAN1]|uniref:GH1 family beta-glucosidase n=1 Tax=Methylocystis sp. JAN1 TaxID=3397211 RepID=UPI003FA1BC80
METKQFPDNFLWGVATSAYQIEGAPLADGAGPSDWHQFTRENGRIVDGGNGDVACDHYNRYDDDIRLIAELGVGAYRFSVSWSRIFPQGVGPKNPKGLDFYDRLVDGLLARGIEPFLTLHHWDLPAALAARGGWLNRDSSEWFGEYAHTLFRALKDRVRFWTTHNEPWVVMHNGYVKGVHPPGRADLSQAATTAHNLLRAHGRAVQAFRADPTGKIGVVVNLEPKDPASGDPRDIAAANAADAYMNRFFLDPLLLGSYPKELPPLFGAAWPAFPEDDMRLIREPFDYLGVNYYTRSVNRADPAVAPDGAAPVRQQDSTYTEMGWEVHSQGLARTLLWLKQRYGDIALFVTENGAAFADPPEERGAIRDHARVDYLRGHLRAAHQAIGEGVNLQGYFVWSLFDNFEWTFGYTKRFGVLGVDFATQRRTPKLSAEFYRETVGSRGRNLFT